MIENIIRWLLFTVIFSLSPVVFSCLLGSGTGFSGLNLAFMQVIQKGEILLLSVGLSGAAIGEMIGKERCEGAFQVLVVGISFLNVVLSIPFYIAAGYNFSSKIDPGLLYEMSLISYCCALSTGFLSTFLTSMSKQ